MIPSYFHTLQTLLCIHYLRCPTFQLSVSSASSASTIRVNHVLRVFQSIKTGCSPGLHSHPTLLRLIRVSSLEPTFPRLCVWKLDYSQATPWFVECRRLHRNGCKSTLTALSTLLPSAMLTTTRRRGDPIRFSTSTMPMVALEAPEAISSISYSKPSPLAAPSCCRPSST